MGRERARPRQAGKQSRNEVGEGECVHSRVSANYLLPLSCALLGLHSVPRMLRQRHVVPLSVDCSPGPRPLPTTACHTSNAEAAARCPPLPLLPVPSPPLLINSDHPGPLVSEVWEKEKPLSLIGARW